MNLATGLTQLHGALKTLRLHWEDTKPEWRDQVRHDFEENYWTPLELQVQAALQEMDRLSALMARMQQETT